MSRVSYRPEIDGLRAIAVLAVVLFHCQLKFPGGYVGVDIFFVISGFLITRLITIELAAGTFSLRQFWERRVRRIMPAASATVLGCLLLGVGLMLPTDLAELGRSAVAQVFLCANIFFYHTTGYFGGPAGSKPLLHFWSLAVEEQFYLFFPFLLLALQRTKPSARVAVVGALALASLVLSAAGVARFPDATFYLLPARAWELAIGAVLALRRDETSLPVAVREAVGWLGLALMVAPMFFYDDRTPFPGLAALPPCLGTAVVIWATAGAPTRLQRLLSLRPVVFIGLISYSLYLWHWPLKVFSHYWYTGAHSPLAARVAVVLASFGAAWLSWRYVETPFRSRRHVFPIPRLLAGVAAASAVILLAGITFSARDGLPGRFSPEIARYDAAYRDRPDMAEADLTTEAAEQGAIPALNDAGTGATLLIWGDSHARVVSPAVEAMCRDLGVKGYRASRSETAPLLGWGMAEKRRHNAAVFRWIQQRRPSVVVLVARWERVLRSEQDEAALAETVRTLERSGVKVAIMRQVASQRRDIPKSLARAALLGDDVAKVGVRIEEHAQYTHRSNEMIDEVVAATHPLVLDPIPYLARDGRCLAAADGRPLYYDYQHLTRHGAALLEPMFASLMRRAVGASLSSLNARP